MSHEILIHTTPHYLQVAYIEDNQVQEIDMEPHHITIRVGDIYYGKVVRILPAMRVAFVEIGMARTALLHFTDVPFPEAQGFTDVAQYLRVGQLLIVQVSKLPRGEKGAIVNGRLQLIGGLTIYQPLRQGTYGHIKVSKRITDAQERRRLADIVNTITLAGSVMVRSLAQHQPAALILQELQALQTQWQQIQLHAQAIKTPQLLLGEKGLAYTYLRDHMSRGITRIEVEDSTYFAQLSTYLPTFAPSAVQGLQQVTGKRALWRTYQMQNVINAAMARKVGLPSGGYIIIEATEAMTVVDVNTGQSVKSTFQTNREAAQIVAKQIRLRNIGGVMVIDFIRMREVEQQQQVLDILRAAVAQDSVYTMIYEFSPLGLVEMNRQRHGNSWVEYYKNDDE